MKRMLWVVSFFISFQVLASDKFNALMDEKYGHFVTIERPLLENAINTVPTQQTLWGCGLHQVGHALVCAGQECAIDFNVPGDYPLAVDIDCNKNIMLGMLRSMVPTDNGVFRVGATPRDMGTFLQNKLAGSACKPFVRSAAQLNKEEFMGIIQTNVEHSMPTLAYYVIDANTMLMHIYAVVGYSDDEVLVLDTKGTAETRLKAMAIDTFIVSMNAQSIISRVRMVDNPFVRGMITGAQGRVASEESLAEWNAYSLIGFSKPEASEMPADVDLD